MGNLKEKKIFSKDLWIEGAKFEIGQRKFKLENLYYTKQGLEKGKFKEGNISKTQSNLIYFFEYLRDILKIEMK